MASIAVVEDDQIYYLRTDHIGRPRFATNAAGLTVWQANYLPFGKLHVTTGNNPDLRFPGQWFQAESGLFQNWMRDYDPTLGRYLQADPLGLVDGPSIYGYALQNPQRYTDPTGEFVPVVVRCLVNTWCRTAAGAAAGAAYGYFVDDDGCYTIEETLYYAVVGAGSYYGVGKGIAPVFRPNGSFGKGRWFNTGRYWRVGWNRKGGNRVFRWYDKWTGKTDFFAGGPL